MHDVPALNNDGTSRFSAPLINIIGRSASSIDNAHAVSFFMINDEGTWLIKHLRNEEALALLSRFPPKWEDWTEANWLEAAAASKHLLYRSGSISRASGPITSSGIARSRTVPGPRSCYRSWI